MLKGRTNLSFVTVYHNNELILADLINPFSAGTVFIRQNLTHKGDLRSETIKIFLIVVDP